MLTFALHPPSPRVFRPFFRPSPPIKIGFAARFKAAACNAHWSRVARLRKKSNRFPKRLPYDHRCHTPTPFGPLLQSRSQRMPVFGKAASRAGSHFPTANLGRALGEKIFRLFRPQSRFLGKIRLGEGPRIRIRRTGFRYFAPAGIPPAIHGLCRFSAPGDVFGTVRWLLPKRCKPGLFPRPFRGRFGIHPRGKDTIAFSQGKTVLSGRTPFYEAARVLVLSLIGPDPP